MNYWKCTKIIVSDFLGGTVCFTEGKLYQGKRSVTPGGEWAMRFTNDLNEPHLMTTEYLYDYFTKASDLEIMIDQSHQGDPCVYCGKPHDKVGVGPCPGRISPTNKMLDSLACECGGQYEHVDQEENGWDDTVTDSYQCNKCETWCMVTWDKETEKEVKREYEDERTR